MEDKAERKKQGGSADEEYVIRVFDDPAGIDAAEWESLRNEQPSSTPFVPIAYLHPLHESGSAVAENGRDPPVPAPGRAASEGARR